MSRSRSLGLGSRIGLCVVIIVLLGSLSGILGQSSDRSWYQTLTKPPGTPPGWLFGPVWTLLYSLMGVAVALIWQLPKATPGRSKAMTLFALQMALNLAWTPVFFGARQILPALVVIIALWILIALTIRSFLPIHRSAGRLLFPYLAWVSYATYLNAGFLVLN